MPDPLSLMDGMEPLIDEIHVHCDCLAQELEPNRGNIELNLANGCIRWRCQRWRLPSKPVS